MGEIKCRIKLRAKPKYKFSLPLQIHRPIDLLKACGGQNFQIGVPSWWDKGKKGVACSKILLVMSESFSPDDVLDLCVIWRSETNLEKQGAYILVATRVPD